MLIALIAFAPSLRAQDIKTVIFHLPGIGGHMAIDDALLTGLQQGLPTTEFHLYDWTNGDPGMPALVAYDRNQREAGIVAEKIHQLIKNAPQSRIIVTSHSGGGGISAWALEKLPADAQVDTWLMVAPALSPQYDLSKALKHVRGKTYVFSSTLDPILGFGTRNFGTMDRVYTASGGNTGFILPASADVQQYQKLVQIPYDAAWMPLGNAGDHIGAMNRAFARTIIAPLLLNGIVPAPPSTQPTTLPASR